jgi:hypothetical protein
VTTLQVFTPTSKPNIRGYQALVLAQGLETWHKFHRPLNTSYTPKSMMYMATAITGQRFGARDYLIAAAALREYASSQGAQT